ncbi:MAG: hypothetical protein Fur005_33720 [Roseiflexaceae bacterium]
MKKTASSSCIIDNQIILQQGIRLLNQLDDQCYTRRDEQIFRSSVGTHMRHLIDFYLNFMRGLAAGRIDYDHRERNVQIEQDRSAALAHLEQLLQFLEQISEQDPALPLLIRQDTSLAAEDPKAWGTSSLRRELQALVSHTIHHYALIAVLLRHMGLVSEPGFGVAPSTLQHWKQAAT